MSRVKLDATTARTARQECRDKWPNKDVSLWGYDANGLCVFLTTVRAVGDNAPVATARRNRSMLPVRFEVETPA